MAISYLVEMQGLSSSAFVLECSGTTFLRVNFPTYLLTQHKAEPKKNETSSSSNLIRYQLIVIVLEVNS